MSLITFSSLSKSFGPHDIFRDLSGAVPHASRIGLVGPNGIGKTTLLRMFAGLEDPSGGAVHRARGLRVGYLPQEAVDAATEHTVWEEMLTAFAEVQAHEAELRQLEAAMADPAQFETASLRYGHLQEQFEHEGGYVYESQIKQTLNGLGFDAGEYARSLRLLSGGQKTRALLARLLLEAPDLLILDEPTNHLDIAAVEWLEIFLSEWAGSALIVSHDRYFLDEATNKIWEMTPARIEEYTGNYSAYLRQRAERRDRQLFEYEAQQAQIAKEEDYIRRNIAGQNTAQAKGRRRRLERLKETPGAIVERPRDADSLKLSLDTGLRSGDRVVESHDLVVGYADDGKPLFAAPDLLLWRGEVAALIGPNGTGKSTFLKTLLGQLPPLKGRVKLGTSLKIGYFAQAHEGLHPERTAIEEIQSVREMPVGAVRDYLAKFLFTGDDVFKKVQVLSGGERGRVALAKLAMQGANFLLLDEPTNHLDIPSQEILEAVLSDFDGTILLVSHDRYLIDALATQIWSLEARRLEVFKGSYREFVGFRSQETEVRGQKSEVRGGTPELRREARGQRTASGQQLTAKGQQPTANRQQPTTNGQQPTANNQPPTAKRRSTAEERRRAQRVEEMELLIASLEKRLTELTAELEAAGSSVAQVKMLSEEYAQVEGALATRLLEWERMLQPVG